MQANLKTKDGPEMENMWLHLQLQAQISHSLQELHGENLGEL